MEQFFSEAVSQRRFNMFLMGLFAALALALTAVGIFGVVSYGVAQRGREIGIRMALGAGSRDVLRLVIRQSMVPVLFGMASGAGASYVLARLLVKMLYGVSATDPATLVVIALLLILVALVACFIPARRATMVDSMVVLRCD
jgi:putative ABC transport system permease protein